MGLAPYSGRPEHERTGRPVVSDKDLQKIQDRIEAADSWETGPDEEIVGYVAGLNDAARILQGLGPEYRGGS